MSKLRKKTFLIIMMVFVSFLVISCGGTDATTDTPTTEDPINHSFDMDTVYYEGNGYEITYGDLYDSILVNDGIDQLIEMVDREILVDYLDMVTTEDIDLKRTELIYGTTDQEDIDDLEEDRVQELQQSYLDGMTILGFSDNDEGYLRLAAARDLYVKDSLTNPDIEDNDVFIDVDEVADKYIADKIGDVSTLLIRFDTQAEATEMLRGYNLVQLDGALRLYTGTTPLNEVPSYNLNEDNTVALSNEDLIGYFIQFYNDVYESQKDLLSESATLEDLIANDDLNFDYETLSETSSALGNLLFETLSTMSEDDDTPFYTYRPYKIALSNGTDYYLALNLDKAHIDLSDFDGDKVELVGLIGQDVYDEIIDALVENYMSDDRFVSNQLKDYREAHDFDIYDYYLKLDYENVVPEDMEETHLNQSDHVIATLDGEDILVKDLLAFALERKAPLYLVHASQLDILIDTHYTDVYCDDAGECPLDWTQNNSGAMNTHLGEYTSLEESFYSSQYSMLYTFEEALYLFYGARNEDDMINGYIQRTLEPMLIYDYIMANKADVISKMMTYINDYYDNYFSLDVKHILIYLDENGDGRPDDYEAYYNDLEDTAAFDALIADYEADVRTYLADNEDNLSDFVSLYNAASRDDEDWGVYKQAGLKVLTENLSTQGSLTYMSTYQSFERPFVDGLIDLYADYILPENMNKSLMYNAELVETSYGLHLIQAEPGDDFELDSAEFSVPDETTYDYPEGLNNDAYRLNASQMEVYFNYRVFSIVSNVVNLEEAYDMSRPDLPNRIEDLMILFVQDLYDAHYASAYLNAAVIDVLNNGDLMDDSMYSYYSEADIVDYFNLLNDVYENQIYKDFE